MVAIYLAGNNHKIMRGKRLSLLNHVFLVLTTLVMVAAAALFFYGLLTGQGP